MFRLTLCFHAMVNQYDRLSYRGDACGGTHPRSLLSSVIPLDVEPPTSLLLLPSLGRPRCCAGRNF